MTRFTPLVALAAFVALGSAVPFAPRASAAETSALTITQDGRDLVVKMSVTANASEHVLWTNMIDSGNTVALRYYVIQNPDLFVRSQKKVDVSWRIPNRKPGDVKISVQEVFQPTSAELKALAPQLQKLAEAGELWKKIRELQLPVPDAPPLTFTRDGTDLVVRATVKLKSNERVLRTPAIVGGDTVTLEYIVVGQDSLSVGPPKPVELTWCVPGDTKTSGTKFVVRRID